MNKDRTEWISQLIIQPNQAGLVWNQLANLIWKTSWPNYSLFTVESCSIFNFNDSNIIFPDIYVQVISDADASVNGYPEMKYDMCDGLLFSS